MADLDQLEKEFNDHKVKDAYFRAETAAYIKGAAEDIGEIKTSILAGTTAQWTAIDLLKDALADEETERKVEDVSLKGNIRMAGYAKIITILTALVVGGYMVWFRGMG